jgi:hypothetical protein
MDCVQLILWKNKAKLQNYPPKDNPWFGRKFVKPRKMLKKKKKNFLITKRRNKESREENKKEKLEIIP